MTVSPQPALVDDERAISIVRTLNHLKRKLEDAEANFNTASQALTEARLARLAASDTYRNQLVTWAREFGIDREILSDVEAAMYADDAAS